MNNDTLNSKQIAHWLVDAEQVLRTADESSDEYAAARAISTLGLALLGTGDELRNLRTRNSEVESLLAVQQRAIDTQREEINSLKSGEPVGYLVGTALLENLTQATAYRDDTGLEIRPLFTASPALAVPLYQWRKVGDKGWRDCKKEWFDMSNKEPDEETRIIYLAPQSSAWHPAETSPDVPRGEFLDCWVAGHFRECDHAAGPGQYKSARPLVLLARWGGTELLRGDEGGWSVVDMPDGSFEPHAWQPIAKPEFPLRAL
ncbi:hypothetical protein OUN72_002831 [Salmonella enterica subsp. enterica serovar Essen]|nr:hypothetical protein [Salmonella enterica]